MEKLMWWLVDQQKEMPRMLQVFQQTERQALLGWQVEQQWVFQEFMKEQTKVRQQLQNTMRPIGGMEVEGG